MSEPDDEWEFDDEPDDHPLVAALQALFDDGWSESLIREFLAGAPWRHRDELQGSALNMANELAESGRLIGEARLAQFMAKMTSDEGWAPLVGKMPVGQTSTASMEPSTPASTATAISPNPAQVPRGDAVPADRLEWIDAKIEAIERDQASQRAELAELRRAVAEVLVRLAGQERTVESLVSQINTTNLPLTSEWQDVLERLTAAFDDPGVMAQEIGRGAVSVLVKRVASAFVVTRSTALVGVRTHDRAVDDRIHHPSALFAPLSGGWTLMAVTSHVGRGMTDPLAVAEDLLRDADLLLDERSSGFR